MPKKSKENYSNKTQSLKDFCQTPAYALEPLLPYLPEICAIWEPAVGEGLMRDALRWKTRNPVIGTDILTGDNFFEIDMLNDPRNKAWGVVITNPPYSLKYEWVKRCYELGYPFALLMPGETLFAGRINRMFQEYGMEMIVMNPRVDFKMPFNGWDGTADYATAWFTWKLGIGQPITYADISEAKKKWKEALRAAGEG